MSKLGLHIISWNQSSQILDFIARAQPRLIKMLGFNDMDTDVARASSPSTLFVGRQYVDSQPLDNPEVNASNFFTQLKPAIDKMGGRIDVWEGYNEIVIQSPDDAQRYNDFTVAWADIMHSQGLKCAAYSFGVANPDLSYWPLLVDGARACDYLALHEYDSPRMDTHAGDFCLRYRQAYASLPPDARRPILITECGIDDGQNQGWMRYATADDYLAQLAWYDGELMKDDYVVGASIFTIDGKDWRYFDVLQIVSRIADYVASHPTPPPPPPPPSAPVITGVVLSPTTLISGQTLNVGITVTNNSASTLPTQGPDPGFVYNEGETFRTRGFPEVPNAFRVGVDFNGSNGGGGIDHPYRWGFGAPLAPGQSVTVNGVINLSAVQSRYYWAGLVQEQIVWLQDRLGRVLITVNPIQPPVGTQPVITNVSFAPTTFTQGQLLQVSVTVQNNSTSPLATQGPGPGFIYNEGDNYLTKQNPPIAGAYRIGIDFDGRTGIDHPYRWGLGASLAPGASAVVNGFVRLNRRQTTRFWVGLIQEQVGWLQDQQGATTITVVHS